MTIGTFQLASSTRMLAQRIGQLQPGDVLTYDEMSGIVSGDIRGDDYHRLASARRAAEREHGVVTETLAKKGIRRVSADGLAGVGDAAIGKVKRVSRRAVKSMVLGMQKTMPTGAALTATLARVSMLGALEQATGPKRLAAIEAVANATGKELPLAETLELFKKP